jgi:hypothetical protein
MGPGMENWLTRSGLRRFSAWLRPPGREDAVGKERVRSTPMPEPFLAIRDVAASRRRALGAQARTSANGRGIDVLRGMEAQAALAFPSPLPEVPAPLGRRWPRPPRTLLSTNAKKVTVSVLYWYE